MSFRPGFSGALGRFERAHLWVAGAALVTIVLLTTADVLARKFWSAPLAGAMELTELLMGVLIFSALPVVSARGEHIAFDALSEVLPARLRRWQNALANVLAAAAWALLALLLAHKAQALRDYGDATPEFKLQMWIFVAVAAAFTLVAALAHLAFVLARGDAQGKEVL